MILMEANVMLECVPVPENRENEERLLVACCSC